MNETIKKIIQKLDKYSNVIYELEDNFILIKENERYGFPVSIKVEQEDSFIVKYSLWHERFNKEEEALNCFVFGLTNQCRLKLTKKRNKIVKYTVQYKEDKQWFDDSTTGFINIEFWKVTKVEYLQNNLIKVDSNYTLT